MLLANAVTTSSLFTPIFPKAAAHCVRTAASGSLKCAISPGTADCAAGPMVPKARAERQRTSRFLSSSALTSAGTAVLALGPKRASALAASGPESPGSAAASSATSVSWPAASGTQASTRPIETTIEPKRRILKAPAEIEMFRRVRAIRSAMSQRLRERESVVTRAKPLPHRPTAGNRLICGSAFASVWPSETADADCKIVLRSRG